MSSDFSFKAAWFHNPFGAVTVAGRAQMLQEVLVVLGTAGLEERWIYRASAWGRVGKLLFLHPSLFPCCTLPGELIQHLPSSAPAWLRY